MKLAFDATTLSSPRTGIGRYTFELLHALAEHQPELDIRLMAHRPPAFEIALGDQVRWLARPRFRLLTPWMQLVLPLQLARSRIDVCHFTNYHAPLVNPVSTVVTVHDVSVMLYPEQHPRRRVYLLRPFLRTFALRADAVVCPSASARDDVIRVLGVDPDRTWVVPGAPAPVFRPIRDASALAEIGDRYGLRPGFLLFVGTIEPRKNLPRLVRAYAALRRDGFAEPLVIAGGWGWRSTELRRTIDELALAEHVRLTGFVPDADLAGLLNICGACVYPSLYEGFGLPILEAFACGAPVVTSDRGATAEVAGAAALLVDPEDIAALAGALQVALTDVARRERLREAGLRRAADFSWHAAAARMVAVYRAVAR